jgi:hypothetical protein
MHLSPEAPQHLREPVRASGGALCTLKRVDSGGSGTCPRRGQRLVARCFFQMAAEPIAHRRENSILKFRLTA